MYTRTKSYLTSGDMSPTRFIEQFDSGPDLSNSTLLYMIDNEATRKTFTITKNERRIDLISTEIYGEEKYSWLLLYMNRISVEELVRGVKLEYIPYSTLEYILSSI